MQFGLIRTALFVPAVRLELAEKALTSGADAIILDLEDSVPPAQKPAARTKVREKLQELHGYTVLVRVNSFDSGLAEDDLEAVIVPKLDCIILPKVDEPNQIQRFNSLLLALERKRGIQEGSVSVIAFVESGKAVENAAAIASEKTDPPRLYTVAFGAADYTFDMGVEMTTSGEELAYARARIGVACKAAGIAKPLDTPFMMGIHDLNGLRADALRARQLGFGGKLCIHPKQIGVCNEVFSPSQTEIDRARRIIEAFREAESQGRGVIQIDGMMVDYPVVQRFMAIIALAERLERQKE